MIQCKGEKETERKGQTIRVYDLKALTINQQNGHSEQEQTTR